MPVTASDSVISLRDDAAADGTAEAQNRHTGAKTPRTAGAGRTNRALTLGTRLALSIAISVATVISLVSMAGAFVAEQKLETDLRETARVTAQALADEIELRRDLPTR